MTTSTISRLISEVLVPLGVIGTGLAVLAALVTCALVFVHEERIGISIGGWIAGLLLSVAAGFSDLRPVLAALGSGVVMITFLLIVLRVKQLRSENSLSRR